MAEADHFAEGMAFAKVVSTENGDALLIAGNVYQVSGPNGNCAALFSSAMRRSARRESPLVSGAVGSAIATSTLNS